jgi:acyl carrier protein
MGMAVAEEVRSFVVSELAPRRGVTGFDDDDDLLASGIIDSLGVTELVTFLEGRFKTTIDPEEVVPENFRSVSSIEAFLARKGLA